MNARGLTYRACCARPALATRGHLSLRVQYVCPFLNYVADMWRTTQKSGIGSVRTVVFARAFPLRQERSERDSERLSFARLAVGRGCDPSARAPDAEPSKRPRCLLLPFRLTPLMHRLARTGRRSNLGLTDMPRSSQVAPASKAKASGRASAGSSSDPAGAAGSSSGRIASPSATVRSAASAALAWPWAHRPQHHRHRLSAAPLDCLGCCCCRRR